MPFDIPNRDWDLFGWDYKEAKKPQYPLPTYERYVEPNAEDEEIVDPISSLMESLGKLKPGEQIWIQISASPIYFGTDNRNLGKSIALIHKELNRLRNQSLGTLQLSRAKNQIKGYLARAYENHESLMLSLGKSLLIFDRIDTMEETFRKIDAVTAAELTDTAEAIFDRYSLSTLIYRQNGERS